MTLVERANKALRVIDEQRARGGSQPDVWEDPPTSVETAVREALKSGDLTEEIVATLEQQVS